MKLLLQTIIFFIFTIYFAQTVFALQIITPKEGQVVYQGDRLVVIVKPDSGEDWEEVLVEIVPMRYNFLTKEYKAEIVIPRNNEIGVINFEVAGYDKAGKELLLKRSLFVKLPLNVVLQGIVVDDYKTLFKLPDGSPSQEMQRIESRQLHVDGKYSDGVERELTSSISGTTYTTSNEKIVIVNSEGKITAQGVGTATITVKNGKYSATVKVVVKPYKK